MDEIEGVMVYCTWSLAANHGIDGQDLAVHEASPRVLGLELVSPRCSRQRCMTMETAVAVAW